MRPDEIRPTGRPTQVIQVVRPGNEHEPATDAKPSGGERGAVPMSSGEEAPVSTMSPMGARMVAKARQPRPRTNPFADIPTMGMPALRYKFNQLLRVRDRQQPEFVAVPRLGNREQELLDVARIKALAPLARPANFTYVGVKGSAATSTVTVLAASALSEYSGLLSFVLDANPAAGTASASLGFNPDATITVQQLWDRAREDGVFSEVLMQTGSSFHHVRPVSAKSIVEENREVPGNAYEELVLPLLGQAELLHVDTANDILTTQSRAVFEAADVLVFTGNHQIRRSLRKVGEAMETLRRRGLGNKVDKAVVVFSNLPKGAKLGDYERFLSLVNDDDEIVDNGFRPFNGTILGLHHDPEIAQDKVVNLWKLQKQTQRDIRTVGITLLRHMLELRGAAVPAVKMVNGQPTVLHI